MRCFIGRIALGVVLWGIGGQACATRGAAPAAASYAVPPVAYSTTRRVADIEVTADFGAWRGDPRLFEHVTPVYLTVANHGDEALHLRHRDLTLVGAGQHAAIIDSEHVERRSYRGPVRDPLFNRGGYSLAPPADGVRPVLRTDVERLPKASARGGQRPNWVRRALEERELADVSLPQGAVYPGQQVHGFVYFDPMHGAPNRYELHANLTSTDNVPLGVARLPLTEPETLGADAVAGADVIANQRCDSGCRQVRAARRGGDKLGSSTARRRSMIAACGLGSDASGSGGWRAALGVAHAPPTLERRSTASLHRNRRRPRQL